MTKLTATERALLRHAIVTQDPFNGLKRVAFVALPALALASIGGIGIVGAFGGFGLGSLELGLIGAGLGMSAKKADADRMLNNHLEAQSEDDIVWEKVDLSKGGSFSLGDF